MKFLFLTSLPAQTLVSISIVFLTFPFAMQYLLELYEKDEEGIKEVLTKVQAQFEILPSRLRAYLNSNDVPGLKLFCHQMTNSALLVGAKKLLNQLSELEEGISGQTLSTQEIEGRIKVIETLLPSELESITIYLQFYL